MMKLVNRLLVIAVIAFGSWFLVQQWDKVDQVKVLDTEVTDVTELATEGEIVITDQETKKNIDPLDKPVRKVQPVKSETATQNTRNTAAYTTEPRSNPVVKNNTKEMIQTEMTIYLFDGGFDISESVVREGQITFNVRNDGRMPHEFAVEGIEDFGRVSPGEMKSFTLNLGAGEYELFSPRAVDRTLNMRETLIVEKAN